MKSPLFSIVLCAGLAGVWAMPAKSQTVKPMTPPVAKVQPKTLESHGHKRIDNYYWLKEREDPAVVAYLEEENRYTEALTEHTKPLQEKLVEEFRARIKQTDISVPYRRGNYYYYSRTEAGKDYPVYCRKKGSLDAPEEVLIDVNEAARGHKFFSVAGLQPSSGENILAWAEDTVGRRVHTLRFKDLASGKMLEDRIEKVTGNLAWATDNKTIFYTRQDPVTLRSHQIWRHTLGTDPSADRLVYEEKDPEFRCGVYLTRSRKFLVISSQQTLSSEYRILEADRPEGEFRVFLPRERNHEYSIDHGHGSFYIRTNWQAANFRLMRTPENKTAREAWVEMLAHRKDVLLQNVSVFAKHIAVSERKDGLTQFRIVPVPGGEEHYVDFGEPAYAVSPAMNAEFDTTLLRYSYSSLTTPQSVFDYDMAKRTRTLLKRDDVGNYDPASYQTERLWATARDGTRVPISLVYRKGFRKNGSHPLLLYGYGSYGNTTEASFRPFTVSLLDRGFVYALAHIRGGQEMGRQWYESGKLLAKKNTFTDFIDCAEFLIRQKYADPKRVFAQGASAGGLLMGAVVNMRPDVWRGVIAGVPFVDVVTTMLDDSIPLTTNEYDEWGNPNQKQFYDYMLSYSPYDQAKATVYPAMLVTTGLHDSQVQYWEPAKWVAKLRTLKKDKNVLLLKTDLAAGHGGASGRDKRYRDTAFQYAFLLDLAGVTK